MVADSAGQVLDELGIVWLRNVLRNQYLQPHHNVDKFKFKGHLDADAVFVGRTSQREIMNNFVTWDHLAPLGMANGNLQCKKCR